MHLFPRFLKALDPTLLKQDLEDLHQALDWSNITFKHDRIYTHRIMRIKFTTYDTRRDEDIIHLDTDQSNIMLLNQAYSFGGPSHPFVYGKVIGILHGDVGFVDDIGRFDGGYSYRRMEFLWVRWYRVLPRDDPKEPLGPFDLDKAELLPIEHPGSHGFVDPQDVIRTCHMVPDFKTGKRYEQGRGKSVIANDGEDYNKYFVNRWVVTLFERSW